MSRTNIKKGARSTEKKQKEISGKTPQEEVTIIFFSIVNIR